MVDNVKPEIRKPTGKKPLPKAAEPYKFKPGVSGNPGGRPKRDIAAEIAAAIFEGDIEGIRKVFQKRLKKGDPRTFTALADRAYGKSPQSMNLKVSITDSLAEKLAAARKRVGKA